MKLCHIAYSTAKERYDAIWQAVADKNRHFFLSIMSYFLISALDTKSYMK